MAIRVRKLAREVRRSPEQVLGVLHALGYRRYRSVDDMIGDDIKARLVRALRSGVEPDLSEVEGAAPRAEPTGPSEIERLAEGSGDVMGRLMRGVQPLDGGRPTPRRGMAPAPAREAPVRRSPAPSPDTSPTPADASVLSDREALLDSRERSLELSRRRLDEDRRQVEQERERVEALRMAVESERRGLQARRDALDELRRALDEERALLEQEQQSRTAAPTASLVSLMEERGLRGADEFERAIVGLARARRLQDVLLTLGTDEPRSLRRLLTDHLLLTGPQPPPGLAERAEATVSVAPDRAEVPDAPELVRLGERLSDALLLEGIRSFRLVGGRPALVRLLKDELDHRVSLSWAPGAVRTLAGARDDVAHADLVVLWQVDEDDAARALYDAARPAIIRTDAYSLAGLVQAVASPR